MCTDFEECFRNNRPSTPSIFPKPLLGQASGAKCTGRVEVLWCVLRIGAVLLRILPSFITPIVTLVLFSLHASLVFATHIIILPFHNHRLNVLKGAIYASALYVSISSTVLAALAEDPNRASVSHMLAMMIPIAAWLGAFAVNHRKSSILNQIKTIRMHLQQTDTELNRSSPLNSEQYRNKHTQSAGRISTTPSTMVDDFFDEETKLTRSFRSARTAHAAIRLLFYEKDRRGECKAPTHRVRRPTHNLARHRWTFLPFPPPPMPPSLPACVLIPSTPLSPTPPPPFSLSLSLSLSLSS